MDITDISLIVVAGGKSSRLGRDKRFIELGGTAMLERLLLNLAKLPFKAKILAVEEKNNKLQAIADRYGLKLVTDKLKEVGPMEGIANGLLAMPTEYAQIVSCDMPFFNSSVTDSLLAAYNTADKKYLALLPQTPQHRQPLAGLYNKDLAKIFKAELAAGRRRISSAIEKVNYKLVLQADTTPFFNVNTKADYRLAQGRIINLARKTPLVTITAPKSNTGKTTFIEKLLPKLAARGIKVGVVKGDAHGYNLDREGKDSYRFNNAGASAVAVVSPTGYFIEQKMSPRPPLENIAQLLTGVDLVLIESRAHGCAPKISLYRELASPIADDDTALLFTSCPLSIEGIYQYDLNDSEKAAELTLFLSGLN